MIMLLKFALFFVSFFTTIQCFVPNCIANNQFKFYSYPVEGCSDYFEDKCNYKSNGRFKSLGDGVTIVKIIETEWLPTCAFFNASELKHIYGVSNKIKVLANGAFINLPNLESINLALNQITEIRQGVFVNVAATILDLSWNNIVYIDHHAFEGLTNLKSLNLSRNSLKFLAINSLPKSITTLNLAHNLLTRVALVSTYFTGLTNINISNNVIDSLAISYHYNLNDLDLTNNNLSDFDYLAIYHVKKLRIGRNLFTNKMKNLENLNAEEVEIYPNPWDCQQLHELWDDFTNLNYRITPVTRQQSSTAQICINSANVQLKSPQKRSSVCIDDTDCPSNLVCKTEVCQDPCRSTLCHSSNICSVKNHTLTCSCPPGQFSDPIDLTRACQTVECFISMDCSKDSYDFTQYICLDNKCEVPLQIGGIPQLIPEIQEEISSSKPWWFDEIPHVSPPPIGAAVS